MTTPDTPDPRPFTWTLSTRQDWQEVHAHRKTGHRALGYFLAPYLVGGAMIGIGSMGQDRDHIAWLALGGFILLIFLALLPFWLALALREGREASRQLAAARKRFWQRYGVDPLEIGPPPEADGERAPWE